MTISFETKTLLSLDRWARLIGLNPVHFSQATATDVNPQFMPVHGNCGDIWFQYDWQNMDRISREAVAQAIAQAEEEIARYLHYWPAPKWITNEPHLYPKVYRKNAFGNGRQNTGQFKTVKTKWAKVCETGQRVNTLIDTPTIVYSDPDGDGVSELATITATTTVTDANEIRLYFAGKSASDNYEIRPLLSKTISGGSVTITVESWKLIDPDLWSAYVTGDSTNNVTPGNVNISTTANFVTTADVYRVYTDHTDKSAQFYWTQEPHNRIFSTACSNCGGTGCETCSLVSQDGCAVVFDTMSGTVTPSPSTYDSDNSRWNTNTWTECREPDMVKLWYYAGDISDEYLAGNSLEPLSNFWAQTIMMFATARLERPVCSCGNVQATVDRYRTDLAMTGGDVSFNIDFDLLGNPFGTRRGEVMAWQRVSKFEEQLIEGFAV